MGPAARQLLAAKSVKVARLIQDVPFWSLRGVRLKACNALQRLLIDHAIARVVWPRLCLVIMAVKDAYKLRAWLKSVGIN